jgi:tetratricopeptide (TPR) repeat protein
MKSTRSYKQKLGAVRRAIDAGNYDVALAEVDLLLDEWPGAASLHVLRAELIQLQDHDGAPPLEEAKAALKHAGDLDNPTHSPLIELGHFQFSVEDDPKAAAQSFKKGVQVYKELLIESLLGQAAALEELNRREEAFDCLSQARLLQTSFNGEPGKLPPGEQLLQRWSELAPSK